MSGPQVGVLTLVDLQNYGNRLQNYAVHRLLRDRGLRPKTIEIAARPLRSRARDAYYATLKDVVDGRTFGGRYRSFQQFSRRDVPYVSTDIRGFKELARGFDCFVIGSDQVWNPNDRRLGGLPDGTQFLSGIEPGRKIALSPSFGVSTLPSDRRDQFSAWLSHFERLSVREDAGADIIKDLTGSRPDVLVDPTMAIEAEHWRSIADNRGLPQRPYLLNLFLGTPTPSRQQRIADFAEQNQLQVVDLADPRDPITRRIGPRQFISLIENSTAVATDSFHCMVFTFMLDRPVFIYERSGRGAAMGSRTATLTKTFSLQDRLIVDEENPLPRNLLETDYSAGKQTLASKRNDFRVFLDSELARAARST